jgi:serine/threonine-protein kinase
MTLSIPNTFCDIEAGAVDGASFLLRGSTDVSASRPARRRHRKVGIETLGPDHVLHGVSLDAMIRAHAPLPVPIVRELLLQVCAALQQAHDGGVTYADVKPANIHVDDRGNVQLAASSRADAAESAHPTRAMMTMGTADYTSPEQCLGQPPSFASDQYSVGLIAYALLTGFPPFVGWPARVQWAHLRELPPWVSFARPDCPVPLAAAVMRMLAKEPNERWLALRNAMPSIAKPVRGDSANGRAALAQLVRDMQTVEPPNARPLPIWSLEIPPRPGALPWPRWFPMRQRWRLPSCDDCT